MLSSASLLNVISTIALSWTVGGLQIIWPDPPESYLSWDGVKYLLGGIEASIGAGSVAVTSLVRFDDVLREPVASGTAWIDVLSVSLYSGPKATGWRIAPTGGWLRQSIYISDFSRDLPRVEDDGFTTIPGTCSDAETGDSVDCALPNAYSLDLQSFYGGLFLGYDFVFGGPNFHVLSGAYATLNAVEYRRADVRLANNSITGNELIFARSAGLTGTLGFALPKWNVVARTSMDYFFFGNFGFGDGVEVRGPVVFDDEKDVYYRPRLEVDEARLSSVSLKFSLAYTF